MNNNNNQCFYTTQGDIKCNNTVENFRPAPKYVDPCAAYCDPKSNFPICKRSATGYMICVAR